MGVLVDFGVISPEGMGGAAAPGARAGGSDPALVDGHLSGSLYGY